jgi:hypothetical protein
MQLHGIYREREEEIDQKSHGNKVKCGVRDEGNNMGTVGDRDAWRALGGSLCTSNRGEGR